MMLSETTLKDEFVKAELSKFVKTHIGLDVLSSIDEIVLSYIIGILESLDSVSSSDDAFDVEEFIEMMCAYIPAFSDIPSSHVYDWMLKLAKLLKEKEKREHKNNSLETIFLKTTELSTSVSKCKCGVVNCLHPTRSRRRSYHSSHSCSSSQSEDEEKCITVSGYENEDLETLTEMFPHLHILEAKQFLNMSAGSCEKAAQLILQKQEVGEDIDTHIISKSATLNPHKEKFVEDKQLREQILKRYAYIDEDDDAREHKPVAPKNEPKKLIRYRDNKIVSIKGERYSEIRKKKEAESGEPK
ncbi:CUE domain-containing protein 2-A isoform X2 [Parasteatoda tepidariorum]|uniref:CUE domain-containing protein 2-A isoform X2 n=1 Tax=Parasteatoda tepidariorum TaxID=114398 RepID=UPI00077FDA65|nr:CUE domain-containing protein 2-A isoform X2 [Parasteatoda tepidariorum]